MKARNHHWNVVYMFLFGFQMCLLFLRMSTILSRTRAFGALVRMAVNMVGDVGKWMFLSIMLLLGFLSAVAFVIADDTDADNGHCIATLDREDKPDSGSTLQDRYFSIALFMLQVMLGQQDWAEADSNPCFEPDRSRIVQTFIIAFCFLGSILMLNLLIALMASTYETRRQTNEKVGGLASSRGVMILNPLNSEPSFKLSKLV